MKKGTKVFIADLIIGAVVGAITDTIKEYQNNVKRLGEYYNKVNKLLDINLFGDVLESACLDYTILRDKIKSENEGYLWKVVIPKEQRKQIQYWDKYIQGTINIFTNYHSRVIK